jgi:hypothetical protein
MHLILYVHLFAITIAGISFVYTQILIKPDHILGGWWKWLKSIFTTQEKVETLRGTAYQDKEHWILKPLGGCIYCHSGQMALWIWLLHFLKDPGWYSVSWVMHMEGYNFWMHLCAVALTIFYAKVFMHFIKEDN